MTKGFFLSFIFIFIICNCNSQSSKKFFTHFTTRDGLSHNGLWKTTEDKNGFLWITTTDGLNRFDGKSFDLFFHSDGDSNSIVSNNCGAIFENNRGEIVVAGEKGISIFRKNNFKTVPLILNDSILNISVFGIIQDSKNNYWVLTMFDVYEFDQDFHFIKKINSELLAGKGNWNISKDNEGNIWLNRAGKMNLIISGTDTIYNEKHNPFHSQIFQSIIHDVAFDRKSDVWAVTDNNTIINFSRWGNELKSETLVGVSKDWFIKKMYISPSQKIWIVTTDRGLFLFNPDTKTFENFIHSDIEPRSLCSNLVWDVFEDRYLNTWVSTANGLDEMSAADYDVSIKKSFLPVKNDDQFEITNFILDGNLIWASLWNHGIAKIDKLTGDYNEFKPGNSIRDNMVWDLERINNLIWFGNFKGAHQFNFSSQKFSEFNGSKTYPSKLDSIGVIKFFRDSKKNIWMSLADHNGIVKYDSLKNTFEEYNQTIAGDYHFPFRHFDAAAEDLNGNLWFGYMRQEGLATCEDGKHIKLLIDKNGKSVFHDIVNCIVADGNYLWIGANSGLYKFNILSYSFDKYTRKDGLPNDYILSVALDENHNLWIGTDNGLGLFNAKSSTIETINTENIIAENSFRNAVADHSNHLVYFNTTHIIFSISTILKNKQIISVIPIVTSIDVMGKPQISLSDSILNIDYDDKYFSIGYSAPLLPFSLNNRYAYKLVGFDKDWNHCGNRQFATYTNLRYGNYLFRLKASADNIHWFELKKPIRIHVAAPFYMKLWFIILFVVLFLILSFSVVFFFYRIKLQRILFAQNIRNKIAKDLHDDIGSTLSSISFMTEIAKQKTTQKSSESEKWFERIGESSRELIDNMSDIVWNINPQNDSMESMISRMEKFCAFILDSKNITYDFEIKNNLFHKRLSMDQRKNLFLIFKEIINNAAKYSECNFVSIKISEHKNATILYIKDDGKGFESIRDYEGNGIKNIKKRAVELKADLEIISVINIGTEYKLTF